MVANSHQFTVGADDAGTRLDRFCVARLDGASRNQVQALNSDGAITIDGARRPHSYTLHEGERVEVRVQASDGEDAMAWPEPEEIAVGVVYEDTDLVVVNKPAGLVVHPAHGNWSGTLVNALLGRGTTLSALGGPLRPGIVHRLDKDTTGLMVVARSDEAYRGLVEQIKARRMVKQYHAIAWGHLSSPELTIEAPIARHPADRQKMAVSQQRGRPAASDVFVVDSYSHFDYIRVTTLTGRTHQIRVHLSHVSHPLLGDPVYGGRRKKGRAASTRLRVTFEKLLKIMQRHALHASRLSFVHPVTNKQMTFRATLPDDMRKALETLYRDDRFKEV